MYTFKNCGINCITMKNLKSVYFIGMGGASMLRLAIWCKENNIPVAGSDSCEKSCALALSYGLSCNKGHLTETLKDYDTVVYTSAIESDNPEIHLAKKLKKNLIERTVFLNYIMQEYLLKIAVSGTHGKSTATGMLGSIFAQAGLFPEVHIGGELVLPFEQKKDAEKKVFITEACEYKKNFLKLLPDYSLILNAEQDHPDCYKNDNEIREAFCSFARNTDDTVIINGEDENCKIILPRIKKAVTFGFEKSCDYRGEIISINKSEITFKVYEYGGDAGIFNINLFGRHNVANALASIAAARVCGIDFKNIKIGINDFKGIKRRLEKAGYFEKIPVISDYAHHPNEIKASLSALKNAGFKKILLTFQPHTYSRLAAYRDGFKTCFVNADRLILTDVYGAREKGEADLNFFATEITLNGTPTEIISGFDELSLKIKSVATNYDCIVIMGAGDINLLLPMIINQ